MSDDFSNLSGILPSPSQLLSNTYEGQPLPPVTIPSWIENIIRKEAKQLAGSYMKLAALQEKVKEDQSSFDKRILPAWVNKVHRPTWNLANESLKLAMITFLKENPVWKDRESKIDALRTKWSGRYSHMRKYMRDLPKTPISWNERFAHTESKIIDKMIDNKFLDVVNEFIKLFQIKEQADKDKQLAKQNNHKKLQQTNQATMPSTSADLEKFVATVMRKYSPKQHQSQQQNCAKKSTIRPPTSNKKDSNNTKKQDFRLDAAVVNGRARQRPRSK